MEDNELELSNQECRIGEEARCRAKIVVLDHMVRENSLSLHAAKF